MEGTKIEHVWTEAEGGRGVGVSIALENNIPVAGGSGRVISRRAAQFASAAADLTGKRARRSAINTLSLSLFL